MKKRRLYLLIALMGLGLFNCTEQAVSPSDELKSDQLQNEMIASGYMREDSCTFTPGYWKNHTKYSEARRDSTWDKIGAEGEDTKFFMTDQSYLEVMKTEPEGNAYYILAFQYIAAKLNMLKGASAPDDVMKCMEESEECFQKYTPDEIKKLKGSDALRQKFINCAEKLDKYNRGIIGPGRCDDSGKDDDKKCCDDSDKGGY